MIQSQYLVHFKFAAGESSSTVRIILIDDGDLTTAPDGVDSLRFIVSDVSSTGDVDFDTDSRLQIDVRDDVKEFGFSMSSDTTSVSQVTTFNYTVSIADTVSGESSAAVADVVIDYTVNTGSAVEGVDFNDITGGSVTIPAGASSADISIQVIETGSDPTPVLTVVLTGATTMDNEILGVSDNSTLNIRIE